VALAFMQCFSIVFSDIAKRLNNPTENQSWEEAMGCCKEDFQKPLEIIVNTCGTCIYAMLFNSVL